MVSGFAFHIQRDPWINGHPLGSHLETSSILASGPLNYPQSIIDAGLL
jgi:hypothetical protein